MAAVDLSSPIYAAIIATTDIASDLATYEGEPAIFTRRPVPADCNYPLIVAAGDVLHGDEDFIDSPMPVIVRDIAVYGQNPDHYRTVEGIALDIRDLFHRQRTSLIISGWTVTDIRCSGPIMAPTDDDATVGRIVTLRIRLSQ